MQRILILGPGGAGKSTFAEKLGRVTGLPVIELDQVFWSEELRPLGRDRWVQVQERLVSSPRWILDGDLGPYDVLEPRLRSADTIFVLDYPRWRLVFRALRRSPERLDFWRWLWNWRDKYRPKLMTAIASECQGADVYFVRTPRKLGLLTDHLGLNPPETTQIRREMH